MHEITIIADVRSIPQSRFAPQFSQKNLLATLLTIGCRYVFFGKELGGKHQEKSHLFQEGCERLLQEVTGNRGVLLCSEKDPAKCHRAYWISSALCNQLPILHILSDGSTITHEELAEQSQWLCFP
jgi:uncharacterized protein (DUF488 family)